jgi:hypothetical protein
MDRNKDIKKNLPETYKVIKHMCKMVKGDIKNIDFNNTEWYLTYSWTIETQEKFTKWLINYLYTHIKARKEIMNIPLKDKKYIRKCVSYWLLNFGFPNLKQIERGLNI